MSREFTHLTPEEFPELLQEIPDAPKELWIEGVLPCLAESRRASSEMKYLAVVGSRKFSGYGKEVCEFLVRGLAGYPLVIVSGLAIGIDTVAHKSALSANLTTLAIPGSGLDRSVLHPPSNIHLADEIIDAGGALMSELPPTAPAGLHTFPRRNRIMAGLAHAVLIIEAGEQSGTLITARLALDYNREVLVVPGSIFTPNSKGTNSLLHQGATAVRESKDILSALGIGTEGDEVRTLNLDLFTAVERSVIELLAQEPSPRDTIIRMLASPQSNGGGLTLPASEANTIIASLELRGIIIERLGEFYLV